VIRDRLRPAALARAVLLPPVLTGAVLVGVLGGFAGASGGGGSHAGSPLAPAPRPAPAPVHNELAIMIAHLPAGDPAATRATLAERARPWRLIGATAPESATGLVTPVAGTIGPCGHFGCPRGGHMHNGVDFLAPTGTPIRAAAAGRVAVAETIGDSGGYGIFICLQHRPDLATCYAHLSAVSARIRLGARVRRNEVIGRVGSTGSSSAPHLHFEVRRGPAQCSACAVDPIPLLDGIAPEIVDLPRMLHAASAQDEPAASQPATEGLVTHDPTPDLAVVPPQASAAPRRRAPASAPAPAPAADQQPTAPPAPTATQSGGAVPELTPAPQAVPPEPQPAQPAPPANTPAATPPPAP
jgi:hypothetical protein